MSDSGGDQQVPRGGTTTTDAQLGPLSDHLGDDETVVYHVEGGGPLGYEDQDGEERHDAGIDPIAVITDRRLYFASVSDDGFDVTEIRYRNLREIEASGGLLRRRLIVRVWDEGTYRFKPARGEPVAEAGDFLETASAVWQRVLAAVEDARDEITELGKRVETGDETASDARTAARNQLETARERIEAGPAVIQPVLAERVDAVETELDRTRVRAHLQRGKSLLSTAESRADEEAWSDAEVALRDALDHATLARQVAALAGFDVLDAIDRELDEIVERAEAIATQPRKIAGLAEVTAREADDPQAAVPAWASALANYRAAVCFDWGGRLGVDRDTDALREQVETAATNLVEAHRALARQLREQGDDARMSGSWQTAVDHYEVALSQLSMAGSVARELRAGDVAAIAAERETLRERLEAVDLPRSRAGASEEENTEESEAASEVADDESDDTDESDEAVDTTADTVPEKPA